ncbi:serine/threonine-protein phosphatase 6 regulatory subunit 3 protein [Dioscorea alata]|uniref:Serine/threonine-protein phosphatase 6 regulatory subunit 3 protein n=2 Tax=Dioscorea alata TaxID=55571 RepID=A0ACB7U272_DIOAL|nr:serine/threonine-protein phosphatase 6 regulatory subunit 3 protein [Dioscorea alata]KAH7654363.1 serine/threonine-protein phosphatase 6 regulatory subunit 3 protein [Dioscorea alata]
MFWRMTGLSTTSPVDSILDKENYSLEELLDEDEIIQECKALNTRLINFLRGRAQVEELIRYIVEEAPQDAEKKRTFKFPFIACELFTCEVDIILRTLVEDEELMNLLFSFLKADHSHSTLLAGYFSKVVICLMLRKTVPLMNYVQGHQEILRQLVDLIGITSILEVLIRLIGADESMYSNYLDAMQWLEDTDVLEMIVDKFGSSDSPEVHANAAEILCAITRYAPPGLSAKICSPGFVGRLFYHALEVSRPQSVLVHSLAVCISLLDPKRLLSASNNLFRSNLSHGSLPTASPETIDGMLGSLGDLLKLLDVSSSESTIPTTYGKLQPPLGKHRLKIVEFVSVLLTIGSEAAEKELVQLRAIKHILDLFFEYPYNNFLHHHVENVIVSCLESKATLLIEHLLHDCDLVGKILAADKNPTLALDSKPTIPAEGRAPPRIGNIGHITRIANKLVHLGNSNITIQTYLQENAEWVDWHANILLNRNAVENVYQWACGRPTALHDRGRESDDEEFRDRDYDVAALANNLTQAFRYGIYSDDDIEEAHGSLERDDEDAYFDDESAEVVISSLRLGDEQESSSLFTNSNWFAFEDDRTINDSSAGSLPSTSPSSDETDEVVLGENDDLLDTATSSKPSDSAIASEEPTEQILENGPAKVSDDETSFPPHPSEGDKPPEWVEWRETTDSGELPDSNPFQSVPNGELEPAKVEQAGDYVALDEYKNDENGAGSRGLTESSDGVKSNGQPTADEVVQDIKPSGLRLSVEDGEHDDKSINGEGK